MDPSSCIHTDFHPPLTLTMNGPSRHIFKTGGSTVNFTKSYILRVSITPANCEPPIHVQKVVRRK